MVLLMKSTEKNVQKSFDESCKNSKLLLLIIDGTLVEFDTADEFIDYIIYKFDDKLLALYYQRCVEHYLDNNSYRRTQGCENHDD